MDYITFHNLPDQRGRRRFAFENDIPRIVPLSYVELGGFLNSLGPSVVGTFELVGGIFLALGLLTRPIALLFAVEWIAIAITGAMGLKPGTSWLMLGATPHYPAFVAALCIVFILRGGGRYSLDRLLGKEF